MVAEIIIIIGLVVTLIAAISAIFFRKPSELSESGELNVLRESILTEEVYSTPFSDAAANILSSFPFVPFAIVMSLLSLLVLFLPGIIDVFDRIIHRKTYKESMGSMRESKLGSKLKGNDGGYKSAEYLVAAADELEEIYEDESKFYRLELNEIINKMDEMLDMYIADREFFEIVMYKYEDTFEVVNETISRHVSSRRTDDADFNKIISDLIEIPYEEIVTEEGFKWLYGESERERDVIRDMKKIKSSI